MLQNVEIERHPANVVQIILVLDNFNRHPLAREYGEHRKLVSEIITILSASISVSSIAARGTRLLIGLLAEEQTFIAGSAGHGRRQSETQTEINKSTPYDKTLDVSAFVKKFCETDHPPPGHSPIAMSHVPLWLQESGAQNQNYRHEILQETHQSSREGYDHLASARTISQQKYDAADLRCQASMPGVQVDTSVNPFGQHFTDSFDIRTLDWFDDLLGLAPSYSI